MAPPSVSNELNAEYFRMLSEDKNIRQWGQRTNLQVFMWLNSPLTKNNFKYYGFIIENVQKKHKLVYLMTLNPIASKSEM